MKRALGITVGKSKPTEYLGRVLKSLGFTTCSEQVNRIRVYRIDPACLSDPDRLTIYHCVAARLEEQLSGEKTIVNWEEVLQPQTQIAQGVSGCTPSPNFINKTSERCADYNPSVPASTDILQNQTAQGVSGCTQGAENLIKTSDRCGAFTNIEWLLQLLADLETQPPHPRFSCDDDLILVFNEAEERAMDCGDELLRFCPNYWERISKAIGDWAEILPQAEVAQTQQEAQLKERVTVIIRGGGCAKYLVQRICEGIAYLKSLSSGVELTAFVSQLQPVTG